LLTKRKLSEAGIRGTIFGVLLLILSLGLFSGLGELGTSSLLTTVSAILILVAGIICFVLRNSVASTPIPIHQQQISQQTQVAIITDSGVIYLLLRE
jgi:hypothetical protein